MLKIFRPRMYVESFRFINGKDLWELGIRGLIFDLDNTIIPWAEKDFSPEVSRWLLNIKNQGFKVCIVSNARRKRVSHLLGPLGIPGISTAGKPSRRAFIMAMSIMNTGAEETAVVGDQIFTDIYGGNRLGLFTILVRPMSKREFFGTKIMRTFEKIILKRVQQVNVKEKAH